VFLLPLLMAIELNNMVTVNGFSLYSATFVGLIQEASFLLTQVIVLLQLHIL
jgi:hypothetical protein